MVERSSSGCVEKDEKLQAVRKGELTDEFEAEKQDWAKTLKERAVEGFDLQHQIARLRIGKNMSDGEAGAIFAALAEGVRSYDQVVEVSKPYNMANISFSHCYHRIGVDSCLLRTDCSIDGLESERTR